MGNIKKQNLVITLLLLISFFFFLSSSSPSHEFQYSKNHGWSPSDNSNNNVAPIVSPLYGDDHDYMIKNSEPPYFMKTQTGEGGGQGLMTTTKMKTKTKMKTRTLNLKNRERSSSDNWSSKRTDDIVTWIKKKIGPGIYNITTTEDAERVLTSESKVVLEFLESLVLGATSKLEDDMNFYQTTNPNVAKLFHIEDISKHQA
ncbi:Protein disulfide isomerase-like 1-4 [Capsicum baccatum]|uniref:Protein disulfide isomerase-like 1-4 n=1 Tax=Capsicum baccatum TaxID=33114 RepID=A0A2G2XDP8_CAPBA|nr:Protein disulfide isomerase-like 1-4 [Capsicum baccatum]